MFLVLYDVAIGRLIPDFVNINGQKKAIDVFGCYWHNCPKCNLKHLDKYRDISEIERKNIFKKYGWDLVVLWEHDLKKKEDYIVEKLS